MDLRLASHLAPVRLAARWVRIQCVLVPESRQSIRTGRLNQRNQISHVQRTKDPAFVGRRRRRRGVANRVCIASPRRAAGRFCGVRRLLFRLRVRRMVWSSSN